MSTIERLFLAAFGLIALYVFLNAKEAGYVIGALGQNVGGLFGTLQGGVVEFPGLTQGGSGVKISRPYQAG